MVHMEATLARPRFGGLVWRLARRTNAVARPLAGHRWNPVFAVVEHRGRRSGRSHATPVAARRVEGGFVISLAFGAQVDWHRNLLAAGGGSLRWRGRMWQVSAPEPLPADAARPAFNPVQHAMLAVAKIDKYVFLPDA